MLAIRVVYAIDGVSLFAFRLLFEPVQLHCLFYWYNWQSAAVFCHNDGIQWSNEFGLNSLSWASVFILLLLRMGREVLGLACKFLFFLLLGRCSGIISIWLIRHFDSMRMLTSISTLH
jgi:hypothetical protein